MQHFLLFSKVSQLIPALPCYYSQQIQVQLHTGIKSLVNTDDNLTLLDLWPPPHQAVRRGQRSIRPPEAGRGGTVGKVGGSPVCGWEGDPRGGLRPSPSEVRGKVVSNWRLRPGLPAVASSLRRSFDCTQVWSGRTLTVWLNIKIPLTVSKKTHK